jgi:hypothetical protein
VLECSAWSALFLALLAAPAWAQAPASQPAAPRAAPPPPAAAQPAPAAEGSAAPAAAQPPGDRPALGAAAPAGAPAAAPPGSETVPFVVQNPDPPAPVARGRLPPPRIYAVAPRPPPPPPRRYGPEGAPFSAGIGASFVYRDDVGYRRLGANNPQSELDLFASYDVLQAGSRLVIAAGLDYRMGAAGSESDLVAVTSHAVTAELIARFKANWLAPHLRAGVGMLTSRLRLEDESAALRLEDREHGALGVLGGGLTLRTPSRLFESRAGHLSSLSFGLLFEGGYIIAAAASYQGKPKSESDVPQQTLSLGSLDQAGGYLRLLGVVRF